MHGGRGAPGSEVAVAEREESLVDALELGIDPLDGEGPGRVLVELGKPAGLADAKLLLEQLGERLRPAAEVAHAGRNAERLDADRDDGRARRRGCLEHE